ncbi:MAG TPA: beta-ketoacyl synthase N-terminal-like domain-containing protein [Myxococcota bacterium]|nr:beta-ketoacyl synthase N-terminal-like domain-containing protein [Myxococcota bacterium]
MPSVGIHGWASVTTAKGHKERFGHTFRRIGPFVKIAQLGATDAVESTPEGLGVFLGTGLGNTADIVPLMTSVLDPHRPRCSPMAFAGCVGNSAAFFVAAVLGSTGPSVTVSQEELSFEAALLEAVIAMDEGLQWALVGGVDVMSGSPVDQRHRVNAVGVEGELGEGAAFILLGPREGATATVDRVELGTFPLDPADRTPLYGWRMDHPQRERRLVPVAAGLRIVEALDHPGRYVHLNRSAGGLSARVCFTR